MSFRLKTILGIALIESVLLLVLVLSSLDFLRTSNEEQLVHRATTTSQLFTSAVKNAVLATDLATLETFVRDILTNSEIVYVRIYGGDQLLAQGGEKEFLGSPRTPDKNLESVNDGVYDVTSQIEEGGIIFGHIALGLSTRSIQGVLDKAQQWVTSIAVLEVLLVAIFSWVLGTYLTRYLSKMRAASKVITETGPGHQLEIEGKDEIAEVAKAFNKMSASLAQTYTELRESIASREETLVTLERNRAKSQAILSSSLDAIITIDQQGKTIDFSEAAEQIFGWEYNEIVGRNMADFIIPPEMQEAHSKGLQHYLDTGEGPVLSTRIQLEAMHKQGHRFPVEVAICPIDTPDGMLFTAFLRDISQQLESEIEMRLIGRAFQTSEAMFITDTTATVIRVNEAFTQISGYQEDELLGKKPSLWASGSHNNAFYQDMWNSLIDKGEWKGEILNQRKSGEIFPEYLHISGVRDQKGSVTHYVAHLVDISEQKANEQKLLDAINQAQQADEAKSRFLAVMSHEIRTPMNAVLGILGLLRDSPLNSTQRDLISTGRESGEMLLSIINDILDFSKMEARKLELEATSFDLYQLLNQSMDLLKPEAHKRGLELNLEIATELPRFVNGDSGRLQQVLVNLINNACKFTAKGSITLRAKANCTSEDWFELHCDVEDTGIGIPAERQQELFEEFSMIDQTHSRAYEGTGLGLAICKRLISLMGGDIGVESKPDVGSRFYFHINLMTAGAGEIEPTQELKPFELPSPDTRILLAEDNPANQRVISAILKTAGLEVDLAGNGLEVVEAITQLPYDIILMDVSMPQMDGMEATRTIRKMEGENKMVPIVALTAHALKGDRERFLASGMNDYLTKPIDKSATLRCIHRWTSANVGDLAIVQKNTPLPLTDVKPLSYVDEAVLTQLVKDTSASIVPELLTGYIEDTNERLSQIRQALESDDAEKLELEVHTLGSSAGAHGNTVLLELSRRIETLCRDQAYVEAKQHTDELFMVAKKSLKQLNDRIKQGFE